MDFFLKDERFKGIGRFERKVWLSSPTMHGDEQRWVDEAIQTNWVSTVGESINKIEEQLADYIGVKYAVALSCGTASLHLATKLAGEKLYGQARPNQGTLQGHRVFCSDVTFDASINPVAYEDGEAVFIDTEPDTWNMDPEALEKAFELYPDVRLVVVAHPLRYSWRDGGDTAHRRCSWSPYRGGCGRVFGGKVFSSCRSV